MQDWTMPVIDISGLLGFFLFSKVHKEMVNLKIETQQIFSFYLYLELSEREQALSFHLNLSLIGGSLSRPLSHQ